MVVPLGGLLELAFADGVDLASLFGTTFQLFDWSGVTVSGTFDHIVAEGPVAWDTSEIYASGEVTLLPMVLTWDGQGDGNWADARWKGSALHDRPDGDVEVVVVQTDMVTVGTGSNVLCLRIEKDGGVVVESGATLEAARNVQIADGSLHIEGTVRCESLDVASGTVDAKATGTLTIEDTLILDADCRLDVGGTVRASILEVVGGALTVASNGTLFANTGLVLDSGSEGNVSGSVSTDSMDVFGGNLCVTSTGMLSTNKRLLMDAGGALDVSGDLDTHSLTVLNGDFAVLSTGTVTVDDSLILNADGTLHVAGVLSAGTADATNGTISVASTGTLEIVNDLFLSDGGRIDVHGSLVADLLEVLDGSLYVGPTGTLAIEGTCEFDNHTTYNCHLGSLLTVTEENVYLDGTLIVGAGESLENIGEHTMTIARAAGPEGEIVGAFDVTPVEGDHLGFGIFHRDVIYTDTAVDVNVFQAAPGDTDGNRQIDNTDLQQILGANSFNNGIGFDWMQGDFDGDTDVDNGDLQLILATGLFGTGAYAAVAADAFDSGLVVVPEPGAAALLTCGLIGLALRRAGRGDLAGRGAPRGLSIRLER